MLNHGSSGRHFWLCLAGNLLCGVLSANATPSFSGAFGDNMVLQQGVPIPVWGQAQPGEKVEVGLDRTSVTALADTLGKWKAVLPAHIAGGPYHLALLGKDTVRLTNVMVGEVWVCSGQSNMAIGINSVINARDEIADADFPMIRLAQMRAEPADEPTEDLPVPLQWRECTPETIARGNGGFSAVAYFFGRELATNLDVPVGLIQSAWGGTRCEVWTDRQAIAAHPQLAEITRQWDVQAKQPTIPEVEYNRRVAAWEDASRRLYADSQMTSNGWAKPSYPQSDWKSIDVPGYLEKGGIPSLRTFDGVIWFRTTVTVPRSWENSPLTLRLGPIDDFDHTFFNGTLVGTTGPSAPAYWLTPRVYRVPASIVKSGRAVVAVRVIDNYSNGGFTGDFDLIRLCRSEDTTQCVVLDNEWRSKVEQVLPDSLRRPTPPGAPEAPGSVYNSMIHPLTPLAIRGVIWYQGEANVANALRYRTLFPTMIADWRGKWKQGDFPFYFVQLPNYSARKATPSESQWAELREAQSMALSLPKTGMAVTIDVGEGLDLHPPNKQDVGKRLGLCALAGTYGKKLAYSGPMYQSMRRRRRGIVVSFSHCGKGLCTPDNRPLQGFAVAGEDRQFVWADARIESNTVVVSSPKVFRPVAVRYAWQDNPACNLYNKDGLPASPFRSDSWDAAATR